MNMCFLFYSLREKDNDDEDCGGRGWDVGCGVCEQQCPVSQPVNESGVCMYNRHEYPKIL